MSEEKTNAQSLNDIHENIILVSFSISKEYRSIWGKQYDGAVES